MTLFVEHPCPLHYSQVSYTTTGESDRDGPS